MKVSGETERTTFADKIVWLLFVGTCIQLAFLEPWLLLIPGERANVFSGQLCTITLAAALLVARAGSIRITGAEVFLSLGLLTLAMVSAVLSLTPRSSTIRTLVVMASGLGGFWCARILLNTPYRQRIFAWLCLCLLVVQLIVCFWGYRDSGQINEFLYSGNFLGGNRLHQLIHILFLLAFGPLALISWGKPLRVLIGVLLLGFTYLVLFLAGVQSIDSGVLIPPVLFLLVVLVGSFRAKTTIWLLIVAILIFAVAANFAEYYSNKDHSQLQYQSYRVESYPFSWHIAKKHPFLGIGLRSPRQEFLQDYDIWHPQLTKENLVQAVKNEVTSENIFLTFMVGLGIPFVILYSVVLLVLLWRLVRESLRSPPYQGLHPLVLLIPLTAGLLHSLTTDTLMSPQLTWYFHIFLGLIPKPAATVGAPERNWSPVLVRGIATVGATILGTFLGTHPAFAPDKLPSKETISAYGKEIPIVKLFFYERKKAAKAEKDIGSLANVRPDVDVKTAEPKAHEVLPSGTLVVNIQDYKGVAPKWAIMVILDNSQTMAGQAEPWSPDRMAAERAAVADLVHGMPQGSKIAVRDFFDEVSGRKKGRELRLRVSRVLLDWADTRTKELGTSLNLISPGGENNLCTAAVRSLRRDFQAVESLSPRLVLITDGQKKCSLKGIAQTIEGSKLKNRVRLDVIAIGMKPTVQEAYAGLAKETGGELLKVDQPTDLPSALAKYIQVLQTPQPEPVQVAGEGANYRILPGEKAELPPGSYSVTLPEIQELDPSKRTVQDVKIGAGDKTILDVRMQEGRPVVGVNRE
ncbi:MAG: O-antigen ligase family protein [Desulfomonilaceae bacterium]